MIERKYRQLSSCCKYAEKMISAISVSTENYVSTENMLPARGGVDTAETVPSSKTFHRYDLGDILLSNIRPYFQKIWFADKVGGCSADVLVLETNESVNNKFLYYVLSDSNFFNYATVTSKGTKMPRGSKSAIMRYLVPDISLDTQKKIADILSAYDDLIENNLASISLLEKMASELYKEWFVRFRFPGHEAAKFVDGVPEGWEVVQVESVSSLLRRGISPVYNDYGEYTVINQKCIRSSILSLDEARKQERKYPKELNLQDADIVICSTGTGTLGRVGKVFGDLPNTTYDSHVTVVRAAENIGKHYLYHTLKINQTYLMSQGRGSTNQQELSRDTIKKLKIFLPTTEIMQRFEEFIEPIHREIILSEKKLANLTKQRDLLLPRLMSGKLSVEPLLTETA